MDTISLLIPTHNRVDQLAVTLDSIEQQQVDDPNSIEVIVVANCCNDNTIDFVSQKKDSFPFTLNVFDEQQPGLPSARNRAVKEASNEILAFIDDDVVLDEKYLQSMLDIYDEFPADLVGGRTELLWQAVERPDWLPDEILNLLSCKDLGNESKEVFSKADAIGCNFSYRKTVAERVGDFKLGLGRSGKLLVGGEETEFIERALNSGLRLFYAPKCFLYHWVAPNRPTLEYLTGVAQGNAVGFVFARSKFNLAWVAKALVFHLYRYLQHLTMDAIAVVTGNNSMSVFHRVRRHSQIGDLKGIWLRLVGRSTLQK